MNRRQFLFSIGAAGFGLAGYQFWPEQGFNNPCLAGLPDNIKKHPLKQLVSKNLLDVAHADFLKTIRLYNPIMFDFSLKRLIAVNGNTFSNSIFETRRFFEAN